MYVPAPEKTRPFGAVREGPGRTFGDDGVVPPNFQANESEHHGAALEAQVALRRRRAVRPGVDEAVGGEARLVLVHVQLPLEAEEGGVRVQEALDVRLGREHVELLLLERAQVLGADLRRELGLREIEALTDAGLAEAVAEIEH
jgi:hypothetical protein